MVDGTRSRAPGGAPATAPHGDPLLRRVGRGVVRAFRPADDVFAAVELGEALQQPITTGRRIVVGGPHGGVEQGTVAALVAMVFAHYRQDRVLALDIDPGMGSLALRLGVRTRSSLGELAGEGAEPESFERLEPHLSPAGERLWVLPGTQDGVNGGDLGVRTYQDTLVPLTRFFGITLIHCGAEAPEDLTRAALAGAHASVLVAPATRAGAVDVGRTLDSMIGRGDEQLLARTVVVFAEQDPDADPAFDRAGAADIIRGSGAGVVRFGYDRHLALATALDPLRLARATHATVTGLAAEALRRSV
ncbi:MinD/ParA family ATP-binding protein [Actinorugispora endophytica]|uniref:MinD-like ATPase involved in chromosome partitioning or flagellar assembly n=1 Tax=Actinorugispora endophytica TaxID=1605990 RepID=A0A4R6V1J1_9ACTN|nr:hypothetical protein [Actinorugispora endophytica]TDQ52262.1 hypothetical protein EV190_10794 [Actinorugispora endophytica]